MFNKKNKSKKGELPDLPESMTAFPSINDYRGQSFGPRRPIRNEEIHNLPSFPDSPMQKGFSQSAIKDAVGTEDSRGFSDIPEAPDNDEDSNGTKIVELEEWQPEEPEIPANYSAEDFESDEPTPNFPLKRHQMRSFSALPPMPAEPMRENFRAPTRPIQAPPQYQRPIRDTSKPLFVKLDKFKEAKESLDIVTKKLTEMDKLLKMVKETKTRESQEIIGWETEIEKVKARINSVNQNIFENAY
ncbi:MAG: hypothetical protein Q8P57_00500 [Candidatus Pacearchaeota archaeon]|nr:hypothetical protein [Candidatus Pacearchaeota archaeon]